MRVEARVVGRAEIDPNMRVFLDHLSLRDADYSGRVLLRFGAFGSRLEHCRFENARFDDCSFGEGRETSEYIECSFDGLCFGHSNGGFSRFVRCSFRNVNLRDWFCFSAEFIDCIFTGRLKKCIFNGTVPEDDRQWVGREWNEFHGNDFSGADLVDVAFRTGIDLEQQRLPTGPEYLYLPDAVAAIERARRGLANWMPGTELQRRAMVLVNVYADTVENGQRQLFLRPSGHCKAPARMPREAVDKVVELLSMTN
jgi:hypothetical protein